MNFFRSSDFNVKWLLPCKVNNIFSCRSLIYGFEKTLSLYPKNVFSEIADTIT